MGTYWLVREGDAVAGWEHGLPPGIAPEEWPRSRASGLPLMHGFTITVPEEFRVKGSERVALSYFHPGDSESYPSRSADRVAAILGGEPAGDEPFWQALAAHAASRHPATVYLRDILEHDHSVMWHTAAVLERPRCPRPETDLPDGIDGKAMHLDNPVAEAQPLYLTQEQPSQVLIQLGTPLHPVQCSEEELAEQGFGDRVMEIETDVGGANYGDGNCQIDLEADLLDWACT